MKIIDILQKILREQTVEPAAQDVTATKYTNPEEPKKSVVITKPKQSEENYSQQIQDALSNLNSLGYSKEEASAIVANMRFESFLNPESLNKNDKGAPAFGLIQWRGTDVRYENGKLATTINVRGVELKQDIAVKLTADDKKATIKGKFEVDFSKLNMKGMQPEPGSTEHVLPTISFDLNLSLAKK